MGRRIGLICFNEEIFEDIFRIPKGVRVHGMWHDMSNRSIMIRSSLQARTSAFPASVKPGPVSGE